MKHTELLEQARAHAMKAVSIAQAAKDAGKELSADDRATYDEAMQKAAECQQQAKAAKADADRLGSASDLLSTLEQAVDLGLGGKTRRPGGKSLGNQIVDAPIYKALIKGLPADPTRTHIHTDAISVDLPGKAVPLFTGESDTSAGAFVTPDHTGIVEMLGRRPLVLADVISQRTTGSDVVYYTVQTAHANNAAIVPEATNADPIPATRTAAEIAAAGLKPYGSWTFEGRSTNVETIAEMAAASKRALSDAQQLRSLIDEELRADLDEVEEWQQINGTGMDGQLRGILNTAGRQAQAWDTDLLTTTLKAKTKAQIGGRVRGVISIGLNPQDDERINLLRENGNTGAFLGGGPFGQAIPTLWGMPRIVSEAFPAGVAVVGGFDKAVSWDRQQTTVTMTDSHEDFFARNLAAILAEKRKAFAVTRPAALVEVDLTA